MLYNKSITIGDTVISISLLTIIQAPFSEIGNIVLQIKGISFKLERIYSFFHLEEEVFASTDKFIGKNKLREDINICNTNIQDYGMEDYRKNIMFVQSDICILNESVMENLKLLGGREEDIFKVVASVVSGMIRSTLMLLPPFFIRERTNLDCQSFLFGDIASSFLTLIINHMITEYLSYNLSSLSKEGKATKEENNQLQ